MTLPLTSQLCSGDLAVHVTIPEGFSPVPQSPTAAPLRELCLKALQAPVGFPELWQCVIPGDNVAVAIDPEIPDIAGILSLIHEELQRVPEGGVSLTLVLPADPAGRQWQWLRELLPLHLQQSITFVDHDVADRTHVSYIASSLSGERIYLNRHVAEADLIITIGITRFDPAACSPHSPTQKLRFEMVSRPPHLKTPENWNPVASWSMKSARSQELSSLCS